MYESVKSFRRIEVTTKNPAVTFHVIFNCLLQTVQCVNSRILLFEAELISRCFQMIVEDAFENVLKELGDDWRDGDAAIVTNVRQIALLIFYDWHHETESELPRDE